jgi:hypothetical protein
LSGWRRSCATADAPRLRADVGGAFVDRLPIDWAALLMRVRDPRARAVLEDLHDLDRLRGRSNVPGSDAGTAHRRLLFLRCLVAVAALQTAFGLFAAGAALVTGRSLTHLVFQLLLALAFAGTGLLLGAASPRERRSLFLLATFVFTASAFAHAVPIKLSTVWPAPLDALFRGMYPEAFAPAALWEFAMAFPHVRRFTSFDMFARRAAAAAWALGSILFIVNLALAYHVLDGHAVTRLSRDHAGNLFWHLFALASLAAVATILERARRAPVAERRKVVRFASAVAAGAGPFLMTGVVRMALPGINDWVLAATSRERLWLDIPIVGALAAMPVLTTLALIVDRPFAVQLALPRYRALRRPGHRNRLTAALERVRRARGSRELVDILRRELQFGVGAASVRIVDRASLTSDTAIIPMLDESTAVLDLSKEGPLFGLLPRNDREWLEVNGIELAAAVKLRDGAIAAVVGLGAKHGHAQFDRGDRWFISTLLAGAAVAWDSLSVVSEGGHEEPAVECSGCGRVADSEPVPCGCGREARTAALPIRLAGKFTVLRRLGSGGMGVVYLGRDRALERDVALKTLPELLDGAVSRITDEARAMAALNHESLATIYGLEFWRRTPVLVVEYFPEGTLADRLARGPMPPGEAVALGSRVAGALAYMHARGVVHRDIKPSNIGLTAGGAPKLLDFGLAADGETFAGTPEYLPPEALDGTPPTAAVDLWGLSTVLLEACGGRGALPPALAAFFDRALAPAARSRFQSSEEIRGALASVAAVLEER